MLQHLTAVENLLVEKMGLGSNWGRNMRLTFEHFAREGFGMSEEDYPVQVELLGREPEDYAAWVKKEGGSWKDIGDAS